MFEGYFVQEIKKKAKGKYEVSLEGGEPLVLYGKELSLYGIKEEHAISAEIYEQILAEVLSKRATKRAMHLLEKQDYTEKALRDKLQTAGYPQKCIEHAIKYVKSYHYIDDYRYAENYIRYHMERESKRIIKQKLIAKGVPASVIDECIEEFYDSDEKSLAIALLKKKHYDPQNADMKEKQRVYAFLARKGISSSVITSVMRMDSVDID